MKAYKRHVRYRTHLLPWTSPPDSSKADMAAPGFTLGSAGCLPGTPGTQTLAAITCWAAAPSPLLLNGQASTRCDLPPPWCRVGRPTCLTSRVSREGLRPWQTADRWSLRTSLCRAEGSAWLFVFYLLASSLANIMCDNSSLLPRSELLPSEEKEKQANEYKISSVFLL